MNVTTLIFLGLAVVWAIVLVPEAVRKLSVARSGDSIRSFHHQLSVLDRADARRSSAPPAGSRSNVIDLPSRSRAASGRAGATRPVGSPRPAPPSVRKRRQEVITVLGSAAVITLLGTVAFGGAFLVLHLIADVLLVGYLVALAQLKQQAAARGAVARPARTAVRPSAVGEPVPRRIAN